MSRPIVTFLSDFGSSDPFVGICHGVIVRTCPDAEVIHLGHGIRPQAVGQGARVLAASITYLPVGVHMAKHVVPSGFGDRPRIGPAMPVSASTMSAWLRRCNPSAMAHAVSILTEPLRSKTVGSTPNDCSFASLL